MRSLIVLGALATTTLVTVSESHALWGSLIRKGLTTTTRKAAPVLRKVAPRVAVTTGLRKAGQTAATRSAVVVSKSAAAATRTVVNTLGIQGAKAMSKLSPKGAKQLAGLATRLAKSPHKTAWLSTIAKYGDNAVAWLWKRKGAIAVGSATTAVLLAPENFIAATERLASKAMEVTGEHVAKPMATAIARPLGEHLAAHGRGLGVLLLWGVLLTAPAACIGCWLYLNEQRVAEVSEAGHANQFSTGGEGLVSKMTIETSRASVGC